MYCVQYSYIHCIYVFIVCIYAFTIYFLLLVVVGCCWLLLIVIGCCWLHEKIFKQYILLSILLVFVLVGFACMSIS
ncbi:hypothetical protein HMPREF1584_01205 [Gardnerella vaginalis JCP8481A]|nr:hypothetical protein HMPREF1584_01205 [Gardnerella vaginalis JCP8481A]